MQVLHAISSCLLDSAIQRTPRGGTVRVAAQELGGGVQIQVSDCGQEMAEQLTALLQTSAEVRRAHLIFRSNSSDPGSDTSKWLLAIQHYVPSYTNAEYIRSWHRTFVLQLLLPCNLVSDLQSLPHICYLMGY